MKTVCCVREDGVGNYDESMQQPTPKSGSCTRSALALVWESGWFSQDAHRAETKDATARKQANPKTSQLPPPIVPTFSQPYNNRGGNCN